MTTKAGKTTRVKESAAQLVEAPVGTRVTISLPSALLKIIDRYANTNKLNRSKVFEKALLLWYEALQEEADREFYSAEAEDPEVRSWSKVTAKAARYLWND